jgi:hypothetical protein
VPDLLLVHADGGVTVVDVKPASRVNLPPIREVFDWTAGLGRSAEVSRLVSAATLSRPAVHAVQGQPQTEPDS